MTLRGYVWLYTYKGSMCFAIHALRTAHHTDLFVDQLMLLKDMGYCQYSPKPDNMNRHARCRSKIIIYLNFILSLTVRISTVRTRSGTNSLRSWFTLLRRTLHTYSPRTRLPVHQHLNGPKKFPASHAWICWSKSKFFFFNILIYVLS